MPSVVQTLKYFAGVALFLLGYSLTPTLAAEPIHIVFDIDWTLTSNIPSEQTVPAGLEGTRYFKIGGDTYRLSDGVEETLRRLLRYPHVKISFFSGGAEARNEAVLKNIILDSETGKSAFDVAEKILSFSELDDLYEGKPIPSDVHFADRYRKNLARHFGDIRRVFIVEDTEKFIYETQVKTLFHLGDTYDYYRNYSDVLALKKTGNRTAFTPPTRRKWEIDRARIPIAGLMIEEVIEADLVAESSSKNVSFLDRIQKASHKSKYSYYRKLGFTAADLTLSCPGLFSHVRN